jgi:hypothetical protein
LEKGPYVRGLLRPSEGDEKDGVTRHRVDNSCTISTSALTFSTGVS